MMQFKTTIQHKSVEDPKGTSGANATRSMQAVPVLQKAVPEEELLQKKPNNTGLPDNLKSGVENLSGFSMDDVKVHYNSDKPTQLQAHAYAQGTDIHVAPGQEKHLPHEAWHVVQQKQGRVQPTMQMKEGVVVNDDKGLENEADVMGEKALQLKSNTINNYVVQFGKHKVERLRRKEKEKEKEDQSKIDPTNKSLREGLTTDYTSEKLDVSEGMGGHARDRHAGKEDDYLKERNIPIASTFDSEEEQDAALEQLLKKNGKKVQEWISEQYPDSRLTITGEITGIEATALKRQKQVGVTQSGYEYHDPTVARFVNVEINHATAVLERFLIPGKKKGDTPTVSWKLITCYPC